MPADAQKSDYLIRFATRSFCLPSPTLPFSLLVGLAEKKNVVREMMSHVSIKWQTCKYIVFAMTHASVSSWLGVLLLWLQRQATQKTRPATVMEICVFVRDSPFANMRFAYAVNLVNFAMHNILHLSQVGIPMNA